MIYNLLHKIFGWDYVAWKNTADSGIARVQCLPDRTVYYWRYKNIKVMDVITDASQVKWLTCLPSKYFEEK